MKVISSKQKSIKSLLIAVATRKNIFSFQKMKFLKLMRYMKIMLSKGTIPTFTMNIYNDLQICI